VNYETKKVPVTFDDGKTGEMVISFPIKEKEKVYIVGCAGSKDIVPWDDKDAEYWGVNNLYGTIIPGAHYDRWFEIHNIWQDQKVKKLIRRGLIEFRGTPVLDYLHGLGKLNCTVYMQKHWPDLIPLSIPYPLQEIVNFFISKGLDLQQCRYLTNTISYEVVLAIFLGFKEIQVWGVDMAIGTEYEAQRPSCEFWLGVAAGMGIKVFIPNKADLLKTRFLYGFEEKQQDSWREKLERIRIEMKTKRIQIQQRHAQDAEAIQQHIGGEQVLVEIQKIWSNFDDDLLLQKRGS
jgi:hypothetical protein